MMMDLVYAVQTSKWGTREKWVRSAMAQEIETKTPAMQLL